MKRIKKLNLYQKILLLGMLLMAVIFFVLYRISINEYGYEYNGEILVRSETDNAAVYSGKINGRESSFIVEGSSSVVFKYGDKTYGPYTQTEDPSAAPDDKTLPSDIKGIEIRNGNRLLFRGGVWSDGRRSVLFNEDGSAADFNIYAASGSDFKSIQKGTTKDFMEPSVFDIVLLLNNPALTHKGEWFEWVCSTLICVFNAILIIFADEIFRLKLAFIIKDVEEAEPSGAEIMGRYASWTVLAILALIVYCIGLGIIQ